MTRTVFHLRSSGAVLGAERVIAELCHTLPAYGYSGVIGVFADPREPEPAFARYARDQGLRVATIHCRGRVDRGAVRSLRTLLGETAASVLHCHGYKEDIYGALVGRAVPRVATNHLWKRTTAALRVYAAVDAFVLRRFDHIVAVSRPIADEMAQCRLDPSRITVIPNGIRLDSLVARNDAGRRELLAELRVPESAVVVTVVASLTPEKGHAVLLDALSILGTVERRLVVLFVGDGPCRTDLEKRASALAERADVRLLGTRSDVTRILGGSDVFVLPSYAEGLPMALLEAMGSGLAVVGTTVGEVPRVVDDGRSGRLVPPGDPRGLAAALETLVRDDTMRRELGRAARDVVRTSFSSEAMAASYAKVYDSVLSR